MAYNLSNSYNIYPSNSHTPSNRYPFSVTQIGCLSIVLFPLLSLVYVLPSSRKRFRALPDGPLDHPNLHAPLDRDASYSSTAVSLSSRGRAHLQRRLYLVPSIYLRIISLCIRVARLGILKSTSYS